MSNIIKVLQTTLRGSLSTTGTSFTVQKFVDSKGVELAYPDFNGNFVVVIEQGTQIEIILCDGITQSGSDDTAVISVATNGRHLNPQSPYTGGSTGLQFTSGATVRVTNDPYTMSRLANIDRTNTFSLLQTFTLAPQSSADAVASNELVRKSQLDSAVLGTLSSAPVVVPAVAGETVAVDQLVYFKASDSRWWLADADTASTVENVILGITRGAGTAGVEITNGVTILGEHIASSAIFVADTAYYASNTAGGFSASAGTKEVSLGQARTTTKIYFAPRYNQTITEDEQDALVGFGTPSSSNKYLTQVARQQLGAENFGVSAVGTDAYAVTYAPAVTAYANGMHLFFEADVANTGACTFDANGVGAKAIKKLNDQDTETGDIEAGQIIELVFDSSADCWQMVSQIAQVPKSSALQDTFTAGTYSPDISAGDAVFLHSDGYIYPFSSALSTSFIQESHFIGFANEAITAGNTGKVNLWGVDANQSGLTVGGIYRLGEAGTSVETSYTSTVDAQSDANGVELWQSFTVGGSDVDLVSATIYFNGGSAGGAQTVIKIYTGEGTGGTLLATGTKATTGTTPTTATIALDKPIKLSASTQYTVSVQTNASAQWDRKATTNPYAGGRASTDANSDFKFAVNKADGSGLGLITTSGSLTIVGLAKSATEVIIRHDDNLDA